MMHDRPNIVPVVPMHYQSVANMIASNDKQNRFTLKSEPEDKKKLMLRIFNDTENQSFIKVRDDIIIGYLCLVTRKSASQELIQEYINKGPDYQECASILVDRPNLPKKSEGLMLRVSIIIPEYERRKGHGRDLMEFAERKARENSEIKSIELDVKMGNRPAIKLYESMNYKKIFENEELGLITFQKKL